MQSLVYPIVDGLNSTLCLVFLLVFLAVGFTPLMLVLLLFNTGLYMYKKTKNQRYTCCDNPVSCLLHMVFQALQQLMRCSLFSQIRDLWHTFYIWQVDQIHTGFVQLDVVYGCRFSVNVSVNIVQITIITCLISITSLTAR